MQVAVTKAFVLSCLCLCLVLFVVVVGVIVVSYRVVSCLCVMPFLCLCLCVLSFLCLVFVLSCPPLPLSILPLVSCYSVLALSLRYGGISEKILEFKQHRTLVDLVILPDYQTQFLAIEILLRMVRSWEKKSQTKGAAENLKKRLPKQVRDSWDILQISDMFEDEVRFVLNTVNRDLRGNQEAVLSLEVIYIQRNHLYTAQSAFANQICNPPTPPPPTIPILPFPQVR
jgi:hypothetical protein